MVQCCLVLRQVVYSHLFRACLWLILLAKLNYHWLCKIFVFNRGELSREFDQYVKEYVMWLLLYSRISLVTIAACSMMLLVYDVDA